MRKRFYSIGLILTLSFILWSSQQEMAQHPAPSENVDQVFGKIEQAIKKSDAIHLSEHFNKTVELTIAETDEDYAKNQAQFVLREFFQNYPVRTFTFSHKGNSGETFYAVGVYVSERGSFDTNIFLKKYGDSYLIEQIRFEKSN